MTAFYVFNLLKYYLIYKVGYSVYAIHDISHFVVVATVTSGGVRRLTGGYRKVA